MSLPPLRFWLPRALLAVSGFLLLILLTVSGCGEKRILKKNPRAQHYTDQTRLWFPQLAGPLTKARFVRADRDEHIDLLVLKQPPDGPPVIEVWINPKGERFVPAERFWTGQPGDRVRDIQVGHFTKNFSQEVVLIGRFEDGARAKLLSNNGRGYYYEDKRVVLPAIRDGMDQVNVLDLDQDHNPDLLFFGDRVVDNEGKPSEYPIQFFLNKGGGQFQDRTRLLWPPLPPGIAGGVYADYDNDRTLDVFLYYKNGQNRLLLNNGLGKLTDTTKTNMPPILDHTLHADWADFDQDGDQDMLVLNQELAQRNQSYEREVNYALENNGQGYFTKKPLKVLPPFPATGTYLLEGDGDEWADMLLVTPRGTYYYRGAGPWKFSIETKTRLPSSPVFTDLTFADVNDDTYLDLFGIDKDGRGYLWINTF